MKLIDKILDNYFKEQFINYVLNEVRIMFKLDTNIIEHKDGEIEIQFKPRHYNVYTTVLQFHKGDSLNWLINLRSSSKNHIVEKIRELDKTSSWQKK